MKHLYFTKKHSAPIKSEGIVSRYFGPDPSALQVTAALHGWNMKSSFCESVYTYNAR